MVNINDLFSDVEELATLHIDEIIQEMITHGASQGNNGGSQDTPSSPQVRRVQVVDLNDEPSDNTGIVIIENDEVISKLTTSNGGYADLPNNIDDSTEYGIRLYYLNDSGDEDDFSSISVGDVEDYYDDTIIFSNTTTTINSGWENIYSVSIDFSDVDFEYTPIRIATYTEQGTSPYIIYNTLDEEYISDYNDMEVSNGVLSFSSIKHEGFNLTFGMPMEYNGETTDGWEYIIEDMTIDYNHTNFVFSNEDLHLHNLIIPLNILDSNNDDISYLINDGDIVVELDNEDITGFETFNSNAWTWSAHHPSETNNLKITIDNTVYYNETINLMEVYNGNITITLNNYTY